MEVQTREILESHRGSLWNARNNWSLILFNILSPRSCDQITAKRKYRYIFYLRLKVKLKWAHVVEKQLK